MPDRSFSLVLFGSPIVRRVDADGASVELAWRLHRSLRAVAFLALQPDRRAPRGTLVEALFPEAGAETVRKNFHPTLSDARRTLGTASAIVHRQGVYLLSPEIDWEVDVDRFRQTAAAGAALSEEAPGDALETWREAWRLYRGPLLLGVEAPWVGSYRDTLREEYLALLGKIGEVAADQDEVTEALDAYRTVLLEEPYEERTHRAVMELYGRQGRRDLVRRQYVRLQETLKELGVEPLEETQACYHRLMS